MSAGAHGIDVELRQICKDIVASSLSEREWAERESDDMFQSAHYCGGYDADEQAFCFSYYDAAEAEWWFQLSLREVEEVASGGHVPIAVRPASAAGNAAGD